MASDLVGAALIEAYLSARQVRYFRGHHDDEFFFLINAYHGRLHVHLEVPATDREVITISIAEERYYPATLRGRLTGLVDEWNKATPWAKAALVASSDPNLLGIAAHNRYSRKIGDFTTVVDHTLQSAIELFGRVRKLLAAAGSDGNPLRDAG
ncbi:MAG: hypothetical protein U0R81_06490 [Mycobacterium sp.]